MSVTWQPRLYPPELDPWAAPNGTPRQDAVLQAVSVLLGVGTGRLQSDLSNGQSLQSIASAQHVTVSALTSTIAQALQSSDNELSSTQAQMMAAEIAQRSGAMQLPAAVASEPDQGSTSAPLSAVEAGTGQHLNMQL